MKTKIVLTAMLSLLCVMTLTGCRININTRDGSKPKVDIEIPGVDVKVGGFEDKDSAEISGSSSETPIGPIETLAIENEIGDVKVRYTDDSKVSVDYRIRVRGGSNSDNEKAADLVTVGFKHTESSTLLKPEIDGNTEIGNYVKDKFGSSMNVEIDLEVSVPAKYTELSILDAMGNVEIEGFTGKVSVKDAMGNIEIKDVTFTGESTIESAMGDVKVSLKSVTEKSSLKMQSAMGNVEVDTNGLKMSLPVEKKDGLSGSLKTTVGALLDIEAETAMGEAKIK